jgi:hypothetical protein
MSNRPETGAVYYIGVYGFLNTVFSLSVSREDTVYPLTIGGNLASLFTSSLTPLR